MSNATYQLNACGCVTNLSSERSSNGAIDLSGTLVVDDELNFDPETQSIVCAVDASANFELIANRAERISESALKSIWISSGQTRDFNIRVGTPSGYVFNQQGWMAVGRCLKCEVLEVYYSPGSVIDCN